MVASRGRSRIGPEWERKRKDEWMCKNVTTLSACHSQNYSRNGFNFGHTFSRHLLLLVNKRAGGRPKCAFKFCAIPGLVRLWLFKILMHILVHKGVSEIHASLEVTRIGVALVPYSETFRLAMFRLFSKAFRVRAKVSIFPISLTLEERYHDQADPFSYLTLNSLFLPVTQLAYSKSWVMVSTLSTKDWKKINAHKNINSITIAIGGYTVP